MRIKEECTLYDSIFIKYKNRPSESMLWKVRIVLPLGWSREQVGSGNALFLDLGTSCAVWLFVKNHVTVPSPCVHFPVMLYFNFKTVSSISYFKKMLSAAALTLYFLLLAVVNWSKEVWIGDIWSLHYSVIQFQLLIEMDVSQTITQINIWDGEEAEEFPGKASLRPEGWVPVGRWGY